MQALLALGLIFAFIPFVAKQMADQTVDSKMFTATKQIETAQTAAKIFITGGKLPRRRQGSRPGGTAE